MKKKFSVLAGLCMLVAFVSPAKDNNENREVPLFKENKGQLVDQHSQSRQDIQYYGSSDGLSYFFKNTGISYQLYKNETNDKVLISRIDMTWEGANTHAKIISANKAITTENFYNTPQPDGITGVRNYGDLQYKDIYAGIDLHYYYKDGSLKYDFIVAPGANYKNIQIKVAGATSLLENKDGTISIKTPSGVLTEGMPVAYQNGREIKTSWILEKDVLSFQLSEYNAALPLVIDPLVYQWTTSEGTVANPTQDIDCSYHRNAFDPYRNIYVVKNTSIAVVNTASNSLNKYNNNGTLLWTKPFYTTPTGNYSVSVNGISVDASNVYIAGVSKYCYSIATSGAYQTSANLNNDGYLIKFDTSGTKIWSTYYGGSSGDILNDCKVDSAGNVFVCGLTGSTSNMATPGAHQTLFGGGGYSDGLITKFNSNGLRVWSTYFGGNSDDAAKNIDVRGNRIYVTGSTKSPNGIASPGAYQTAGPLNGWEEFGFLLCMDTAGVSQWSTYFGTMRTLIESFTLTNTAMYIAGYSNTPVGIGTPGTFYPTKPTYQSDKDAFVNKFDLNGVRKWGTLYGGYEDDYGYGIATGSNGNIFLSGNTRSSNGIATPNAYNANYVSNPWGNAFVAELDTNGQRVSGTYINAAVAAEDCSANNMGELLISGNATINYNDFDGYVTKFNTCNAPAPVISTPSIYFCSSPTIQLSGSVISGASYQWYRNDTLISGATANNYNATQGGTYKLILDQCPSGISNLVTLSSISPVLTQIVQTDAPCSTGALGSITITPSNGTTPYTYTWDNSTNTTSTLSGLTPGSYIVHTSDVNNCTKIDTVTILNTHNEPVTLTSHTNVPCYGAPVGSATVASSGGTTPYSYAWDGQTATTATITGLATGTYKALVTDANNCMATDSTIVTQDTSIAPSDPLVSLCAVTVDSATGKNIIFWNKTGDVRATSYNVYREGIASGNYEWVGSKSVTDFASIIDTASIPLQQSYSYKVAEVDSCGHEWPLSDLHKTIHLSSNVGVNGENNLSWNIYEGRSYTTHNIWRSFNGAPFTLLNQVSGTITSYSDLTPPTGNNVYRIEIDLGVSCDSLNPGSQHITSNKVSLGTNTTGINGVNGLGNVQIVPNPTKGILHILGEMPAQIKLYDALGRLVTEERNVNKMDIGKFSKGIYMIQLFDKNGAIYHSQKVLLN